jgi:DNA helicase-2/ATP-dependent DNA helicase PcrA
MADTRPVRQDYNTTFLAALDQLNSAQSSAVDQIDGPVMVVAGPGTGKTHILAARIGRILTETDTQANNILCLTFTDAGVVAMRERLLQFIGPEGHRVHIYTFHSFCNHIIQDNLVLFGRQDMEPLTDLDRIDLIRKMLRDLAPEHPLRLGISDPYFYENHLFQTMKTEDWSPALVEAQVKIYLADLPQQKAFIYQRKSGPNVKGSLKKAKIEAEQQKMEKLVAAAHLYPLYEKEKYQARRYDYADMILWVLRAFEENEYLLRNYQEQYLYLLVDEYQDTNGAQNELVMQLANYWELPNIFIVGDDDQSIYEFQGARLKNLTDFFQRYLEEIELVVLEQNYRSTQSILDAAHELIDHNSIRIIHRLQGMGLSKDLEAAHPDRAQQVEAVRIVEYPNQTQEIVGVFEAIKTLGQQGKDLNEVAVIYARHRQVELLTLLLERAKIPYQTKRRINVLETLTIQKVLQVLKYLQQEMQMAFSGEYLLFEILHYDFLGLSTSELAEISWRQALLNRAQRSAWRKLIQDSVFLDSIGIQDSTPYVAAGKVLEELIQGSVNWSLPVLIEQIYNQLQLLSFTLGQSDRVEQLQQLSTFLNFAKAETRKAPGLKIEAFLQIIQRMHHNRIPLAMESSLDQTGAVQLITAHSSKGLEFDQVFILDATKSDWEPKNRAGSFQFSMPDTLTLSGEEDALEARRRLFYVAATRAKIGLQISYAVQDGQGKPKQRAIFIDELLAAETVRFEVGKVSNEQLLSSQILQLVRPETVALPTAPKAYIDELLAGFRMSISALNTYLRCPLSFYYVFILKVPSLYSEAAAYGTAMHYALQQLFLKMQASRPKNFPGERDFLRYFEQEMERLRFYFTADSFAQQLARGRYALKQYYQYHYGRWSKKVIVEYTIRTAEVEGVPLTGTLDKIEFIAGQQVHIVDYKTGRHQAKKLKRPTSKDIQGGIYWRQLVFYKLLYEHFDKTGKMARSAEITYLDPDQQGTVQAEVLDFNLEDSFQLKKMIKETYQSIMQHDFYEGCNEPNCHWCNFVKNQKLGRQINLTEVEELDDQ